MQLSEQGAYAQSKLALTMWSFHLANTNQDISVIPVNPGSLLNTNMVKIGFGYHRLPADKGGVILFELAVSETYNDISGKYYDHDKGAFGEAHKQAYDKHAIDILIQETDKVIKLP